MKKTIPIAMAFAVAGAALAVPAMAAPTGAQHAVAWTLPGITDTPDFDRTAYREGHALHHGAHHYRMTYGQHNHYYHHLHRDDHHNATATGGPAGGLPHRN